VLSRHEEVKLTITCGIDWAEAHHDVALIDKQGVVLARSRIALTLLDSACYWL
jgi:hypothetical protein